MQKLYILCGLPFSGKSVLGKQMSIKSGFTLISYDDVWQALSHLNKNITHKIVLEDCKKQILDLLNNGFSVIYDSANPKLEHRLEIKALADKTGTHSTVIYLELPLQEINVRRAQSLIDKTHHIVSDENFNNAVEQLEPPVEAIILRNEQEKTDFLSSFI